MCTTVLTSLVMARVPPPLCSISYKANDACWLTWRERSIGRSGSPAEGVGPLGRPPLLFLLRLQLPQKLRLQPAMSSMGGSGFDSVHNAWTLLTAPEWMPDADLMIWAMHEEVADTVQHPAASYRSCGMLHHLGHGYIIRLQWHLNFSEIRAHVPTLHSCRGEAANLLFGEAPVAAARGRHRVGAWAELAQALQADAARAGVLAGLGAVAAHAAGRLPEDAAQAAQGQGAQRGLP